MSTVTLGVLSEYPPKSCFTLASVSAVAVELPAAYESTQR